jgi:hypothetical protein
MSTIYLQSTTDERWVKIACDEDTKYWIFDDSCEPVGLTCEAKHQWRPISESDYWRIVRAHRAAQDPDVTQTTMEHILLDRAKSLHGTHQKFTTER